MKLNRIIGTWFGAGYSPIASGTAGSLLTIPFIWLLRNSSKLFLFLITIFIYFLGVKISTKIEKEEKIKDPGIIVIDEVAGMLTASLFIFKKITLNSLYLIFILFRIFDIWKPYPVKNAEKLKNGWGIMTDDILAGIYAGIIYLIFQFFFNSNSKLIKSIRFF